MSERDNVLTATLSAGQFTFSGRKEDVRLAEYLQPYGVK